MYVFISESLLQFYPVEMHTKVTNNFMQRHSANET